VFRLGLIFLLLLTIGIRVIQQPAFLSLFGFFSSPQKQEREANEEDSTSVDFFTVAALAIEETTVGKFRSGGLGLSQSAWEVLHGQPEQPTSTDVLYQGKTYKVTYQQERVWQIEKSWGMTTPTMKEARTRIRRYLPLDSSFAETVMESDGTIIDVYHSRMLAQLLSPQPTEPTATKAKRRQKDLPAETCVVVHWLNKQKVSSTLLHIGAPKPEGYPPPQSQTAPPPTPATTGKNPVRNEARKESIPSGKGKIQGKS